MFVTFVVADLHAMGESPALRASPTLEVNTLPDVDIVLARLSADVRNNITCWKPTTGSACPHYQCPNDPHPCQRRGSHQLCLQA
jgi:hypothetical protein